MDVYDFINSKDIRCHCRKLAHPFNSMETAFLIYRSDHHSIREKCDAWNDVIDTMPDMTIKKRNNCPGYESLHYFLKSYMALLQMVMDEFCRCDEYAIYRMDLLYSSDHYPRYEEGNAFYRKLSDCMEYGIHFLFGKSVEDLSEYDRYCMENFQDMMLVSTGMKEKFLEGGLEGMKLPGILEEIQEAYVKNLVEVCENLIKYEDQNTGNAK